LTEEEVTYLEEPYQARDAYGHGGAFFKKYHADVKKKTT
jgi:hypothetical protein